MRPNININKKPVPAIGGAARVFRLRWVMWLSLSLIYVISYFHRVAPTVVAADLMAAFRTSGTGLGNLGAIYFYVYALMQIPSGVLADTLGPRKTSVLGAVVAGAGSFVFAGAQTLWLAYIGRFLIGFGVSLTFVCILKIGAEWFRENEFATLTGLTLFIGNLGSLLAIKALDIMVAAMGWRSSFKIIGLVTVLLAVNAWFLVKDRPSLLGLPDIKEVEGRAAEDCKPAEKINLWLGLKETLSNGRIWPTVMLSFGLYGTLLALIGMWLSPYLMQVYGLQRHEAANFVLVALLAGLLGPLLMGYFSDRIGRRKMPMISVAPLCLAMWLLLAFWNGGMPPLAVMPYLVFAIVIFSSPASLTWACAKEISHPSLVGISTGIANIGGFLGAALMQPLFGFILDMGWHGVFEDGVRIYPVEAYQLAFLACSVVVVISLIGLFFIEETHCRNIYPGKAQDCDKQLL